MLERGGEGVSDLLDEGSGAFVVGFARADAHPALVPGAILSAEGCDFMRSDAEAGQEQQEGVIPQGLGTAPCPGGEGPRHRRDRQATGERGRRPLAWGRPCGFQARCHLSPKHPEAEQRADGHTGQRLPPAVCGGHLLPDKVCERLRRQGTPLHVAGAELGRQEACDEAQIGGAGADRSTTDVLQVLRIAHEPWGRFRLR
jgi:hypothetical protein